MFDTLSDLVHLNGSTLSPAFVLLGKATVLLAVALAITLVMQRTSAVSRHLVWFASLAAVLIIPLVIALSPVRVPILPSGWSSVLSPATPVISSASSSESAGSVALGSGELQQLRSDAVNPISEREQTALETATQSATQAGTPAVSQAATPATAADAPSLGAMVVAVWALVALAFTTWLAFGMWSVRRIVRRATVLDGESWNALRYEIADRLALNDSPRLVLSDDVSMPFACGLFTPTIVLPGSSAAWNTEQRTAVLLHEMAHIKRRDIVGHTVGRFACALYWFHPLVWTAAKRLRAESERACDDMALLCGARASDYAEHLLDIVARVRSNTTPPVAMAMATRKEFEGRMLAILDPALKRAAPSRRQSAALVTSMVALALLVGAAVPATGAAVPLRASAQLASPEGPRSAVSAIPGESHDIVPDTVPDTLPNTVPDAAPRTNAPTGSLPISTRTSGNTSLPISTRIDTDGQSMEDAARSLAMSFAKFGLGVASDALNGVDIDAQLGIPAGSDTSERPALLTKILRTETRADLRRIAAWGLSDFTAQPAVTEALGNALRRDTSASVREMAAWALQSSDRSATANTALVDAIRTDKSDAVRLTAVWSLASTGRGADSATVGAMSVALKSSDAEVREMAAWGMGSIGLRKAPPSLLAVLRDSDDSVRVSAAWALYRIRDVSVVGALDQALRSEKVQEVQLAQVRALTAFGEPAIAVIKRLIEDPNPEVKTMAVNALAGGRGASPWPRPRPKPRPFP